MSCNITPPCGTRRKWSFIFLWYLTEAKTQFSVSLNNTWCFDRHSPRRRRRRRKRDRLLSLYTSLASNQMHVLYKSEWWQAQRKPKTSRASPSGCHLWSSLIGELKFFLLWMWIHTQTSHVPSQKWDGKWFPRWCFQAVNGTAIITEKTVPIVLQLLLPLCNYLSELTVNSFHLL